MVLPSRKFFVKYTFENKLNGNYLANSDPDDVVTYIFLK